MLGQAWLEKLEEKFFELWLCGNYCSSRVTHQSLSNDFLFPRALYLFYKDLTPTDTLRVYLSKQVSFDLLQWLPTKSNAALPHTLRILTCLLALEVQILVTVSQIIFLQPFKEKELSPLEMTEQSRKGISWSLSSCTLLKGQKFS